jgi:hypothetical protein
VTFGEPFLTYNADDWLGPRTPDSAMRTSPGGIDQSETMTSTGQVPAAIYWTFPSSAASISHI